MSPLDGSGGGVTINFYGDVYGVDDFNEKVNQGPACLGTGGQWLTSIRSPTL